MTENPPSAGAVIADPTVADPTAAFFASLSQRRDPLVGDASGKIRFDLGTADGVEHWLVTLDRGAITVRSDPRAVTADCAVHASRGLFDAIVEGSANAMSAVLRGEVVVDGDLELLMLVERLFGRQDAGRRDAPPDQSA